MKYQAIQNRYCLHVTHNFSEAIHSNNLPKTSKSSLKHLWIFKSCIQLTFNNIFVDDDALMVTTSDMNAIRNLLDQLSLDEDDCGVGRLSLWRHHDLLMTRRQTRVVMVVVIDAVVAGCVVMILVKVLYIIIHVLVGSFLLMF